MRLWDHRGYGSTSALRGEAQKLMIEKDQPGELLIEDAGTPIVPETTTGAVGKAAYFLGSVGLLTATAVDALAVAGRHLGFTVLGSIELVQAAAVLTATSAMVVATAVGAHASVHIVTQRLSEAARIRIARWADALGALLFAAITGGSCWVAAEMWPGFEQTELLGIGIRWLRAFWILGALLITGFFLLRAARNRT
ncbi:MAG: TRAP transporter small permease [Sphingomicrobium sp.]